jgi:uncharacterized Zn ribbon protein
LKGENNMFALTCSCGSTEFVYDSEEGFECVECGTEYTENEAGKHLLEVEE